VGALLFVFPNTVMGATVAAPTSALVATSRTFPQLGSIRG